MKEIITQLKSALRCADCILIGAGAGLSAAAGYDYVGARFLKYFSDFHTRFGIEDIYSGGFYPFSSREMFWAWWSRSIWINRYARMPPSSRMRAGTRRQRDTRTTSHVRRVGGRCSSNSAWG